MATRLLGRAANIRGRFQRFSLQIYALYLAVRDPRAPRVARIAALLVALYIVSPIDLIPEPIPFLGLVDELVVIPLGIALVERLLPADVLAESRTRAQESRDAFPRIWRIVKIVAALIVVVWLLACVLLAWLLYSLIW